MLGSARRANRFEHKAKAAEKKRGVLGGKPLGVGADESHGALLVKVDTTNAVTARANTGKCGPHGIVSGEVRGLLPRRASADGRAAASRRAL